MEEQFVPYDLALKLKELGFDEQCLATVDQTEYIHIKGTKQSARGVMMYDTIDSPLWQQAFDWILDKYNKQVILFSDGFQWAFDLRWVDEDSLDKYPTIQFPKKEVGRKMFNTYKEARTAALEKLIEIVKTK